MFAETGHQNDGDQIPHQSETEGVVDDVLEDASSQGVIANHAAAAGANPTKAEYDALVVKFNAVLGVLRDAGLIPTV
jgi:hypothetical protein